MKINFIFKIASKYNYVDSSEIRLKLIQIYNHYPIVRALLRFCRQIKGKTMKINFIPKPKIITLARRDLINNNPYT